jgi:hypothetical protein
VSEIVSIDGYPPIQLAWRQKVAAFWSIYWPGGMVSLFVFIAIASIFPLDRLESEAIRLSTSTTLLAVIAQGLFVRRLVKKRYGTFRIEVFREGVLSAPALSLSEVSQFSLRVIGPQIAILVLQSMALLFVADPHGSSARAISSFGYLFRFFVVGPYAISFALRGDYSGLRLQAFGQRYI